MMTSNNSFLKHLKMKLLNFNVEIFSIIKDL
jgi:hypothetical protein